MITNFNPETLADRIRSEAAIAGRSGQMQRLEQMADEVARLRQACVDLGDSLVVWMNLAKDATGSAGEIDEDGDGDWGVIAERMAELAATR